MEIILFVFGLGILGAIINKIKSDARKKKTPVAPPKPAPLADLPTGNWGIIADMVLSLNADKGGDTNEPQDLKSMVAMGIAKYGTKPMFIGCSTTPNGVSKKVALEIMRPSAFNIPVFEGFNGYEGGESELGNEIIRATKLGKFTLVNGSPAGDIAWALNNGAHTHNVTCHMVLSWNETGDARLSRAQRSAMKRSAQYLKTKLGDRFIGIDAPEFLHLLYKKNLPAKFKDTTAFINRNRDIKSWDIANSPFIVKHNTSRNNHQGFTTGALRIGDTSAMMSFCGLAYNDATSAMSLIQQGLDIERDRIAQGAVNTI